MIPCRVEMQKDEGGGRNDEVRLSAFRLLRTAFDFTLCILQVRNRAAPREDPSPTNRDLRLLRLEILEG